MSSASASLQVFNSSEPIPGYVVRERIGAGGYGEVWKADAPGGLAKAIKFVYGHLDETRAARELKALSRMKEVRHPFLLSLERIEIIDGHLIIVTELADSNVKQRFDACREGGASGIPREDLLAYMRDTADALDYLFEQFHLQHLDVKPENLLLVGNRIKVADFGLLKDLHDQSASLMGGLTPLYAPPEVYDGRPGAHSDQYSLAVVYQEMLTGEPPFRGRTAAQLAAQHLQGRPILSPLPITDQAVVARALSKDPNKRFASCREFVGELLRAGTTSAISLPPRSLPAEPRPLEPVLRPGEPVPVTRTVPLTPAAVQNIARGFEALGNVGENSTNTLVLSDEDCRRMTGARGRGEPRGEIINLPPVEINLDDVALRPALFIGIGGTAARTLRRLRRRLHDRFGSLEQVPAFQMLLIDSSAKALGEATQGDDGAALRGSETVAMPLRAAQDYRNESKQLLQWMSRRWLYNIPRSLQTEGIRPLGRLVLVDHAAKVFGRLREVIAASLHPQNAEASQAVAERAFQAGPPRVFLIASIDGGTGGGALIEIAYALRALLGDAGYPEASVTAMLTHSTDRKASNRDLAQANAYACLKELYHYSRPGQQYPGDAACGIPTFAGDQRPFGEVYLAHLGDELGEDDFDSATDRLAEYLFLASATPASAFFDRCREQQSDSGMHLPDGVALRTLGLCQFGGSNSKVPAAMAEGLARSLINSWLGVTGEVRIDRLKLSQADALVAAHGTAAPSGDPELEKLVLEQITELKLEIDPLMDQVYGLVKKELDATVEAYFARVIDEALAQWKSRATDPRSESPAPAMLSTLDAISGGASPDESTESGVTSIESVLEADLRIQAAALSSAAQRFVLGLADSLPARVRAAQRVADIFTEYLRGREKHVGDMVQHLRDELQRLREEILDLPGEGSANRPPAPKPGKNGVDPRWPQYARLRMHIVALRGVAKVLRSVQGQVTACSDRLRDTWKDLNQVAQHFRLPTPEALQGSPASAELCRRYGELCLELDRELSGALGDAATRLQRFVSEGTNIREVLPSALRQAARRVVLGAMKEINLREIGRRTGGEAEQERPLAEQLAAAMPRLLSCGGAKRLLLVVPEGADHDAIHDEVRQLAGQEPTIMAGAGSDMVCCYEAEQLSLPAVAAHLIENRGDFAQLAARLHTRTDVDWSAF